MKRIVYIKPVFVVIVAQFFITLFQVSFFPYFSIYLQGKDFDSHVISLLLVIKSIAEVLGILIGGLYADDAHVVKYTGCGFLLLAGAYCCMPCAHSLGAYFLTFGLIGFLYGFSYACESNFVILKREHLSVESLYVLINTSMALARLFAPFLGVFCILYYANYVIYFFVLFLVCYGCTLLITCRPSVEETTQRFGNHGTRLAHYRAIFKNRRFLLFVFLLLLITICESSLYNSLPLYLKERFQDVGVSLYTLIFCINEWIIAVVFIFCRKLIEKLSRIDWIIISCFLYSAVFLILTKYGNLPAASLLLVICFSFAEVTAKPIAYALIIKLADKGHGGKYQAIANLRFFLAGALSSLIGGLFIGRDNYYYAAYFLISISAVPLAFIMRRSIIHKGNT